MSAIILQNVTFGYPGAAQNVFENFSAVLDTDWKLALTGRNGRGKSTLLHLLCGEYGYSGRISAGVRAEYFPYAADASLDALSALYVAQPDIELWRLKAELNKLGVGEEALERPLCTLSGGERTKVLLAALFAKENAFPLIDEPTRAIFPDTATGKRKRSRSPFRSRRLRTCTFGTNRSTLSTSFRAYNSKSSSCASAPRCCLSSTMPRSAET